MTDRRRAAARRAPPPTTPGSSRSTSTARSCTRTSRSTARGRRGGAAARGHLVTLATGRSWATTKPVLEHLELEPEYVVCANGAITMRRDDAAPAGGCARTSRRSTRPRCSSASASSCRAGASSSSCPTGSASHRGHDRLEPRARAGRGAVPSCSTSARPASSRRPSTTTSRTSSRSSSGWACTRSATPSAGRPGSTSRPTGSTRRPRSSGCAAGSTCRCDRVIAVGDGRNDIEMFHWAAPPGARSRWDRPARGGRRGRRAHRDDRRGGPGGGARLAAVRDHRGALPRPGSRVGSPAGEGVSESGSAARRRVAGRCRCVPRRALEDAVGPPAPSRCRGAPPAPRPVRQCCRRRLPRAPRLAKSRHPSHRRASPCERSPWSSAYAIGGRRRRVVRGQARRRARERGGPRGRARHRRDGGRAELPARRQRQAPPSGAFGDPRRSRAC